MQTFSVVKTKGKMFLVTFDEYGVADTVHELKQKNAVQANRVDTAIVHDTKSLIQVAKGTISNNLVGD